MTTRIQEAISLSILRNTRVAVWDGSAEDLAAMRTIQDDGVYANTYDGYDVHEARGERDGSQWRLTMYIRRPTPIKPLRFSAGIYEQDGDDPTGWRRDGWSRHRTAKAAEAAARKYARQRTQATGGAYSWSAWWSDGAREVEVTRREAMGYQAQEAGE